MSGNTSKTRDAPLEGGGPVVERPVETSIEGGGGVRSVRRALDLLFLLSDARPVLSLSECARATGLPKTTTLRLLETLESAGVLWGQDGHYVPGPALLQWSRIASDAWMLPPNVQEIIDEAAAQTGETVNVYVRRGLQRVCIAHAQGSQSLRHVVQVGDQLPLWAGASAKILLAEEPDDDPDTDTPGLLLRVALTSPQGVAHLRTLIEWVRMARRQGWATSHAERDDLVAAVSVPIDCSSVGGVITALSVSGPTNRFPEERIPELINAMTTTASLIARRNSIGSGSATLGIARLISSKGTN